MKKDVIHLERNRREKMTEFYTILQSLVPNLFPKATRTRIIDETISYIKGLEEVVVALDAHKAAAATTTTSRGGSGSTSVAVAVAASGDAAFFGVRVGARPGAAARVLQVFEEHDADVLSATVQRVDDGDGDGDGGGGRLSVTVTSAACDREVVERIKGDLLSIV